MLWLATEIGCDMFWWLRELLACFRFLAVSGDRSFWESKRVYEFVLPLALACILFAAYLFLPTFFLPGFLGRFLGLLFQFMVFVVPFHLAALAAFATFERAGLDEPLKGTNAEVLVWDNAQNARIVVTLTLRQYASLLFGYLCAIGIIFIVSYVLLVNLDYRSILVDYFHIFHKVAVFVILFFVLHYAILSAYAITFLFDKVNRIGSNG